MFARDGFTLLETAFPRHLADQGRAVLFRDLGIDPADPRSWPRPMVRHPGSGADPFREAVNSPRLRAALDQLVGVGRWEQRSGLGTFAIRFPSEDDPGDAGWHLEGCFPVGDEFYTNIASANRSLLMLFLFSDVEPKDAPTRIRVGSHIDVPRFLEPAGDTGRSATAISDYLATLPDRPVVTATGHAGDVYLCHPFLVHAASWPHRGTAPRVIAQPPLPPAEPLCYRRADGRYSPVEVAVRIGLGVQEPTVGSAAQA
jgi:hypothetical protein